MENDLRRWMRLVESSSHDSGTLDRASYWITAEGETILSPSPQYWWHEDEAKKHFPDARDGIADAMNAGWIRINAAGHHFDIQLDSDAASAKALRVAIKLVREIDIMVTFNIEGHSSYDSHSFKSTRSTIAFLNRLMVTTNARSSKRP